MVNLKLVVWKNDKEHKEVIIENPLWFSCGANPIFTYYRKDYVEVHVLKNQTVILDFGEKGDYVAIKIIYGVR